MSAEDRKSCSASLNDRFLVFALIYPGFLTISCNGFVRFRLSASREEEGLKLRQHLAGEEKRRRGGGVENVAAGNCFLRPSTLSARSHPSEGTISGAISSPRLSDLFPFLGTGSHKDRRKCLRLRRIEVNVQPALPPLIHHCCRISAHSTFVPRQSS